RRAGSKRSCSTRIPRSSAASSARSERPPEKRSERPPEIVDHGEERLERRCHRLVLAADETDLPVERRIERQRRELLAAHLGLDREPRRDRQTEPGFDELLAGLRLSGLRGLAGGLLRSVE